MMMRILVILSLTLLMSPGAWAVCTLTRGAPTALSIGAKVMTLSADAPVSTTTPFAEYDSPAVGYSIGYNDCIDGSEYGKRTLNLSSQNSSTKIFATNIAGIGIKVLASNGTAFGNFPSTSYLTFSGGEERGTLDYPPQSFYRIQFFKTSDSLHLSQPQTGDIVLPANEIAYHYLLTAAPSSYTMKLNIGEMRIISTPACTADGAKTVDFNDVTPSQLSAGVVRRLDFSIVCKSDYGSYSAKASMTTQTPSSDGSYIRVKDASGNMDRMGIRITDGAEKAMKVNGSTSEQKSTITSQGPASFNWKATLVAGSEPTPAGGNFTAKAEIVFDIQ